MTFESEIKKPNNRPITLVWMEPKQRLISDWSLVSGSIYKLAVEHFTVGVASDSTPLDEAISSSVAIGEWFFDSGSKELYVNVSANPNTLFLTVTYRLFFSSRAIDLPFDLSSGTDVSYAGILRSTSSFADQIDNEDLIGISLAGSGSVNFHNDGSWKSLYSKLFWETTAVKIYLGFESLDASEYQLIYKGFVDSKSYSSDKVSFKMQDFVEKLLAELPLENFKEIDGDITEVGNPKRRVYGRSKILGVSLSKIKNGFNLTGTFEKTSSTTVTATGGTLLSEASVEDTILYTNIDGEESEFSIESVDSDSVLTLTEEIDDFTAGSSIILRPINSLPYRNRDIFLCHHQMREPTTIIDTGITTRFFSVVDATDFEAGDTIKVAGVSRVIENVSTNNVIELVTDLVSIPSGGDTVVKQPVHNVWIDDRKLVFERDYTIVNGDPSKILIDEDAEFNLAKQQPIDTITFTNGSRVVTGTIDFKNLFKPWDKVRSNDLTHTDFYSVLGVSENELLLREEYQGATRTNTGFRKSLKLINDSTKILVDLSGITVDGNKESELVKTGSQVIRHLLEEQGLEVDATSFDEAKANTPFLMNLALPLVGNNSRPKVRDVIDLVNKSVLGSLHENASRDIVYSTLSPTKPAIDEIFRDDDVISYSVQSSGKNIVRDVTTEFNHSDASIFTGEPDAEKYEYENIVISNLSDITREEQLSLHLWNEKDAELMSQRVALLKETANTVIKLKSNTLFLNRALNEVVYLELRELFERFGTDADQNFIGLITMISKGEQTLLEISDLAGFFNRICTYVNDTDPEYSSSTIDQRAKNGFYTDEFGIIDNSRQYRLNLYI